MIKQKKAVRTIVDFVNGQVFSGKELVQQLPFLLFLVLLALVYIANGYWAENSIRTQNKINNELKELRSEYITTKSDLMYMTKQSVLANVLKEKEMGVEESMVPPKKILVNTNDKNKTKN
jgi:hypothetical protein